MAINHVTGAVVDAALKVHSVLGPGLLESTYQACLAYELRKRGLEVTTQFELPVVYDEVKIDLGYRVDLLVERSVVVELKRSPSFCRSMKHNCYRTSSWVISGLGCSSTSTRRV